jgi:hypothetical protein
MSASNSDKDEFLKFNRVTLDLLMRISPAVSNLINVSLKPDLNVGAIPYSLQREM